MKKHKFTWFDALLILVVIVLILGTCMKFLVLEDTTVTKSTSEFQYTVRIEGVRDYTIQALAVGDTLYEQEGKGAVGVITAIDTEPSVYAVTCYDGTIKKGNREGRYDVTLHITAEGTLVDGHYEVGTYNIYANHMATFFTKYSVWGGYISSLDRG